MIGVPGHDGTALFALADFATKFGGQPVVDLSRIRLGSQAEPEIVQALVGSGALFQQMADLFGRILTDSCKSVFKHVGLSRRCGRGRVAQLRTGSHKETCIGGCRQTVWLRHGSELLSFERGRTGAIAAIVEG